MATMELGSWITAHISELLQDASIIVGFAVTAHEIRKNTEQRKNSNLIELTKQLTSLWKEVDENPKLSRIREEKADLVANPLTHHEQRIVTAFVLHLQNFYQTSRVNMFMKLEGLDADIQQFFSRPIAKAAWEVIKQYQNRDFVKFVEQSMA
jgi:hypothetical protein